MLEELKEKVLDANIELVRQGLVIYTWGNVSGIDGGKGLVVIKPSGVEYDGMKASDTVVLDLQGNVVEGHYNPSSDTPTHLVLYNSFCELGGIVHTHSPWAVAFAQAGLPITAYGTTHADYFYKDVPCTRSLTEAEVKEAYERDTGKVIAETLGGEDILALPGVLVRCHGPFAWGKDPAGAVYNATVLEHVAEMAYHTRLLNPDVQRLPQHLLDKHYNRKHGADAYYGQKLTEPGV